MGIVWVLAMYTIQKAAAILGIGERTLRTWMKRCGVEGKLVETDRRRRYLRQSDMVKLVDYGMTESKKGKSNEPRKNEIVLDQNDNDPQEHAKDGFYTLPSAASLLGIAVHTLRKWIRQQKISKKIVGTDKQRAYISHNDVLLLASLYGREVSLKGQADVNVHREVNTVEHDMDRLSVLC